LNYIGSKYKLYSFIDTTIQMIVGEDLSNKVFCDLFAGTGIVGRYFKTKVKKVISNDIEYYSYVLNRNYIGNNKPIEDKECYIRLLNKIEPEDGFIYKNYCLGSGSKRMYFSDENGRRIDAVRMQIEAWKTNTEIDANLYYFLLSSTIESADKVANTASVYGAFLKHLKRTAQKPLILEPAEYAYCTKVHDVYNEDSNELIKKIQGDILYLDPPYNTRQYGANYHILNTIAKYDTFDPKGKTGLRTYEKSKYCSRLIVNEVFEELVKNSKFQYVILSYNNEGLMKLEEIKNILSKYGKYYCFSKEYQRFKADSEENRKHKNNRTEEYLHVLEKR